MKKYRNISTYTLALDCLTHTYYMRPGEIASLPLTRDVRHYSRLNKLILVREKKEIKQVTEKLTVLVKQEPRLHSQKEKTEKVSKKSDKIEKLMKEMENE